MPKIAYLTYMQVAYISGHRFVHLRPEDRSKSTYSEVTENIVYFRRSIRKDILADITNLEPRIF